MIDDRIATLTAEKEKLKDQYKRFEGLKLDVLAGMFMRISMEIAFLNELNESELSCKQSWYRTTKNYKSVRKCSICGEIKTS